MANFDPPQCKETDGCVVSLERAKTNVVQVGGPNSKRDEPVCINNRVKTNTYVTGQCKVCKKEYEWLKRTRGK